MSQMRGHVQRGVRYTKQFRYFCTVYIKKTQELLVAFG